MAKRRRSRKSGYRRRSRHLGQMDYDLGMQPYGNDGLGQIDSGSNKTILIGLAVVAVAGIAAFALMGKKDKKSTASAGGSTSSGSGSAGTPLLSPESASMPVNGSVTVRVSNGKFATSKTVGGMAAPIAGYNGVNTSGGGLPTLIYGAISSDAKSIVFTPTTDRSAPVAGRDYVVDNMIVIGDDGESYVFEGYVVRAT